MTAKSIQSHAGLRYTLQASEDLRAWTDLKAETAKDSTLEFLDVSPQAKRFYRIRRD
jgi:hypothetical protein